MVIRAWLNQGELDASTRHARASRKLVSSLQQSLLADRELSSLSSFKLFHSMSFVERVEACTTAIPLLSFDEPEKFAAPPIAVMATALVILI